jgi:hypothetical protein
VAAALGSGIFSDVGGALAVNGGKLSHQQLRRKFVEGIADGAADGIGHEIWDFYHPEEDE